MLSEIYEPQVAISGVYNWVYDDMQVNSRVAMISAQGLIACLVACSVSVRTETADAWLYWKL